MPDDGLRFEAWSLPHVGTFAKKLDLTELIESHTFNDRFNDLSDGVFTIPDDAVHPTTGLFIKDKILKIDEANHANDVGSVIRVLRGTTPIMHQIVTRSEDAWSQDEPTTQFSTEGLEWLLDRALVPAFDYPADPTADPDWIYGADSVLSATGFEDTDQSTEAQHFFHTQTSGTYTITYSGQTTSALAFGASWFDVHQALEALSNIQDVIVTGSGTVAAPFVIEFLDPAGNVAQITSSATGAVINTVVAGGVPSLDGWTRSFHPQTGLIHGTYDTFQLDAGVIHGGTWALRVNNGATLYPTDYGGAQQVVSVTGGRTYRGEIWVFPTFTGAFRLIVRTMDETAIDGAIAEGTLTLNTWTKLTIPPFVVPAHIDQIIFRIGNLQSADTGDWYVDDAVFAPGFPAATLGLMMSDIRTASLAAGAPLAWLTPTWSTTLDSDGVAWDATRKWNISHDQSIYQLIEYARGWNYEHRIRWDVADNRFEWDMWNPGAGGQTRTTIAVTGKSGVTSSAPIVRRPPGATYMRVEGELGSWGEFASTTLDDVWGRLEKAHRDRQGVNSAELDILAQRLIDRGEDKTASRSIQVSDPSILPWTAYEPGDMVTLNLAPKDIKQSLRIAAIVVSRGRGEPVPRYDVHFGSPVYSNEAALAQGLKTLIRAFNRPAPSIPAGKTNPMLVGEGSTPTVVIAAANSTPGSKGGAQFHCLGVDDHLVIQQACTWLAGQGGGRMVFCEGDYEIGATIVLNGHIWLMGMGRTNTVLKIKTSGAYSMFSVAGAGGGSDVTFSNMTLDGNTTTATLGSGIVSGGVGLFDNLTVFDLEIRLFAEHGIAWGRMGGETFIHNCYIHTNDSHGLSVNGEGDHVISSNVIKDNGGPGIDVTGGNALVIGNHIISNGSDGIYQAGLSSGTSHVIVANRIIGNTGVGIQQGPLLTGFNTIVGNLCHTNGSHGIQAGGATGHSTVTGNVCAYNVGAGILVGGSGGIVGNNEVVYNSQDGIILTAANQWNIHGNQVDTNSQATNITYDGIAVTGDSNRNFIHGNRVWDLASEAKGHRYGLSIRDANCDDNVFVNNDCRAGGRTANYNNAGTGTIDNYAAGAGPGDNF